MPGRGGGPDLVTLDLSFAPICSDPHRGNSEVLGVHGRGETTRHATKAVVRALGRAPREPQELRPRGNGALSRKAEARAEGTESLQQPPSRPCVPHALRRRLDEHRHRQRESRCHSCGENPRALWAGAHGEAKGCFEGERPDVARGRWRSLRPARTPGARSLQRERCSDRSR